MSTENYRQPDHGDHPETQTGVTNPAPTPRTDAVIAQAKDYYDRHREPGDPPFDNAIPSIHDFARTIERELAEARNSIVLQTDAITQLRVEVERLTDERDTARAAVNDKHSVRAAQNTQLRAALAAKDEEIEALKNTGLPQTCTVKIPADCGLGYFIGTDEFGKRLVEALIARAEKAEAELAEALKEKQEWSKIYRANYGHDWEDRSNNYNKEGF